MTRRLKHPLTPFKMALLRVLSCDRRAFWNIGAHPSHKRRALRELQEDGLVSRSLPRAVFDMRGTKTVMLRVEFSEGSGPYTKPCPYCQHPVNAERISNIKEEL